MGLDMSVGHGSGVIDRAWTDQLLAIVRKYREFNNDFNVPLGAGSNKAGDKTYYDRNIPTTYKQKGGRDMPVWLYWSAHELVEKAMIDFFRKIGVPENELYLPAHAVATAAELAAVQDDGYDINQYDVFGDKELKIAAKHNLGDDTPPDIEPAPYESKG